jgi:uncharacterized membrane protein YccC
MTTRIAAQEAFKFALSMVLFYALALAMNWDMPDKGATALILISLGSTGASLRKAGMRIVGTTVGLLVGFLVVGLFAQNSWLTHLFLVGYVLLIGYKMQISRYSYAWYVAGMLTFTIWATTYGKADAAVTGFHYASFRYLETVAAVTIYTLVCTLFWNRTAGRQLAQQGDGFWADLGQLFQCFRMELKDGKLPDETAGLQTKVSGGLSQMLTTLDEAYADTFKIMQEKRVWENLRVQLRVLLDAIELWGEGVNDARRLNLAALLPGLDSSLEALGRRLEHIGGLWRLGQSSATGSDLDSATQHPEELRLDIDSTLGRKLSHADRAVLLSFIHQLRLLDRVSREILLGLRVVAGLGSVKGCEAETATADKFRPVLWDSQRLLKALSPVLGFTLAFLFWIFVNPPGGPLVPAMVATFSLSFVLTPINPITMLIVFLLGLTLLIAPIYMFVLPALSTGPELLSFMFIYMFVFAFLGGKQPVIKLVAAVLLVNLAGISNAQTYSFMVLAGTALGLGLTLFIIAMVDMFWTPSRPEQIVVGGLQRFFRGCSCIAGAFALNQPKEQARGRRLRQRSFHSMIQPALVQLQQACKRLDYHRFTDNDPEKVNRLLNGVQSIGYRLQALEMAHQQALEHRLDRVEPLGRLGAELRERLQRVFDRWSRGEKVEALDEEREALRQIEKDLNQHLDELGQAREYTEAESRAARDLYIVLGSVRGLVAAMARTQEVLKTINWRQWAATRF